MVRRRTLRAGNLDEGQRQHLAQGAPDFSGEGYPDDATAEAAWHRLTPGQVAAIRAEFPHLRRLWADQFGSPEPRRSMRLIRRRT